MFCSSIYIHVRYVRLYLHVAFMFRDETFVLEISVGSRGILCLRKKKMTIVVSDDHLKCAFHCRDNVHRTYAMPCNSQNASRLANDFKKMRRLVSTLLFKSIVPPLFSLQNRTGRLREVHTRRV